MLAYLLRNFEIQPKDKDNLRSKNMIYEANGAFV